MVLELLSDHTEQFIDNPNFNFKCWLTYMVFDATYQPRAAPGASSNI